MIWTTHVYCIMTFFALTSPLRRSKSIHSWRQLTFSKLSSLHFFKQQWHSIDVKTVCWLALQDFCTRHCICVIHMQNVMLRHVINWHKSTPAWSFVSPLILGQGKKSGKSDGGGGGGDLPVNCQINTSEEMRKKATWRDCRADYISPSFTSHAWLCDCNTRPWRGAARGGKRSKLEKIKWKRDGAGRRGAREDEEERGEKEEVYS